jgi:hypothetical protein
MSYNLLNPEQIITNGAMTGSITSPVIETKLQDNIGFQLNWTGAPVGSFSAQVSMDHRQDSFGNVTNAGNWITLPLDPAITASGTSDIAYIDLNQLSAPYVRIVYNFTSGSGTLNAFITAKGV